MPSFPLPFATLLRLHLHNQFVDLCAHPVKAINQKITFIIRTITCSDRCKNPLLHPFHPVDRAVNAINEPSNKISVKQNGG